MALNHREERIKEKCGGKRMGSPSAMFGFAAFPVCANGSCITLNNFVLHMPVAQVKVIYELACRLRIVYFIFESVHNQNVDHLIISITYQAAVTKRYCKFMRHFAFIITDTIVPVGKYMYTCTVQQLRG